MINKTADSIYYAAYLLFLNLGVISLLLFVLNNLTSLRFDFILSSAWFFSIGIFSLMISVVCKAKVDLARYRQNQLIESIFEISPYFFLSVLIILAVNQFLKLEFIISRNLHLAVLGIAFGFLAFYKNRDKVERDLENEKLKHHFVEERLVSYWDDQQ